MTHEHGLPRQHRPGIGPTARTLRLTRAATTLALVATALLAAGSGCRRDSDASGPPVGSEVMPPDHEVRAVDRAMAVQAIAGAREDAMLFSHHFSDRQVNALGRAKLDLILQGVDEDDRVVVYMALPQDDPATSTRRDAVARYLTQVGLPEGRLDLRTGLNPKSTPTAVLPMPGDGPDTVNVEARTGRAAGSPASQSR